jgi:hypothetical protein
LFGGGGDGESGTRWSPAALLAEAHIAAGEDDDGYLGVHLAHLVELVVVPAPDQVHFATVHRARRALLPASHLFVPAPAAATPVNGTGAAAFLAAAGSPLQRSAAPWPSSHPPKPPSLRSTDH